MFLTGSMIRSTLQGDRTARAALIFLWVAVVVILVEVVRLDRWTVPFLHELICGYLVGVPVTYYLGRKPPTVRDTRLGNASYGTFLAHFPVIYVLTAIGIGFGFGTYWYTLATVTGAVALGALGYRYVEHPCVRIRHRLR